MASREGRADSIGKRMSSTRLSARALIYAFCIGLSVLLVAKSFASNTPSPKNTKKTTSVIPQKEEQHLSVSTLVSQIIKEGKKFLGKPYRYKGPSKFPMDCSGFVCHIFSQFNIQLPRTSRDQHAYTESTDKPQPGDLIFFKGRNARSPRVGHVAMIVEVDGDDITMMHSSCSRGIIVQKYNTQPYYVRRFIGIGRVPELAEMLKNEEGQKKLLLLQPYLPGLGLSIFSDSLQEEGNTGDVNTPAYSTETI